jgi:predicted O-methyltransferase YrrM
MSRELWSSLDDFYADKLHATDPMMDQVLERNHEAGLRAISVEKNQGKMLMLLVQAIRARRVLELGTLGGYGALWLAKGLTADGTVMTLEKVPQTAAIARENIEAAGMSDRIEVREGDATETMRAMTKDSTEPFDFIFIDADRAQLPIYIELSLQLSHPGTIIIVDNTVRYGWVADPAESGPELDGVRKFLDLAGQDPRLDCTVIQTVSGKGHDGFAMCIVQPNP